MPHIKQKTCNSDILSYIYHRHYKDSNDLHVQFTRDRLSRARDLYRKDLKGHFGCVNAIEFSHNAGEWVTSGGDDRRVLLWNTEEGISGSPKVNAMKGQHHSNIFCLSFDNLNKKIFSGGNDEQVVVHDIESGETLDVFTHEEAVYGLSVDPVNDNVFASACDDGRILIYDIRAPPSEDPFCLASYTSPMHAVMYNPVEPRLLATANAKEGIGLWDVRKPKNCLLRYGGHSCQQSCMSVRINRTGDQLIALRRRLPPVLYNIHSPTAVYQFDHTGYYNSCTMKSCCFAGDKDQYLVSGSDDFNLYVWRIPEGTRQSSWVGNANMVLKGHRSIVNQVRFNPANHLLISSGVEKVIKMWSPFHMPEAEGNLGEPGDYEERPVYTHEEYINLVIRSGQVMSHDYSHQSTEEDPRMMAFFDSLVQRELEGWSSDESLESNSDFFERFVQNSRSDNNSETDQARSHSDAEEGGLSPFTIAFASAMANRSREEESDGQNIDLADLNESEDEEEDRNDRMLGQRSTTGRRSISELITQRRKEYLANVKKAEIEAKKRKKGKKQMKMLLKRKRLRERTVSSSDSSSDTNATDGSAPGHGSKRKRVCLVAKYSSDSSSVSENEEEKLEIPQEAKKKQGKKVKSQLLRLRKMRSKVLQSDSDSSVNENGTNKEEPKASTSGASFCKFLEEEIGQTSESEIGPYVSEAVIANEDSKSSCGSRHEASNGVMVGPHIQDSQEHRNDGASNHDKGRHSNSSHSSNSGHSNVNNTTNKFEENSSQSTETTWTEFKRFKSRVEKARRKYRRHSQQESSGEEGS